MSKLKPPGVTINVVDYSKCADQVLSAPKFLSAKRGPVILNSPEEVDDITGEPRGSTREFMRSAGLSCVSVIKKD